MVLQTIDKKDLSLFFCDRWFENVEGDYFTGSVPLSSDKSRSFKAFFARGDLLKVWSTEI